MEAGSPVTGFSPACPYRVYRRVYSVDHEWDTHGRKNTMASGIWDLGLLLNFPVFLFLIYFGPGSGVVIKTPVHVNNQQWAYQQQSPADGVPCRPLLSIAVELEVVSRFSN